jgi:hypothetical protein
LAFREKWDCVPDSGDDPSGDGKGTNNNIAKAKTGFGINSSKCNEIRGLEVTPGTVPKLR